LKLEQLRKDIEILNEEVDDLKKENANLKLGIEPGLNEYEL
jgi:cell division protein FtsB